MTQTLFKGSFKNYWTASFYDFLLWAAFPERKIKKAIITYTDFYPSQNILDFGCGTGTLVLMLKKKYPQISHSGFCIYRVHPKFSPGLIFRFIDVFYVKSYVFYPTMW